MLYILLALTQYTIIYLYVHNDVQVDVTALFVELAGPVL